MTKRQENKLTMYEAVISYLNSSLDKVAVIPILNDSFTDFKSRVADIKNTSIQRDTIAAGKTEAKNQAEELLIESAIAIASALFMFARKNSMPDIKAIADTTKSKMERMRDTDLVQHVQSIYNAASANAEALTAYGITEAKLTELSERIAAYNEALGASEAAAAERTGVTAELSALFKSADELLYEELDKLMEQFRVTDAAFYNGYAAARVIKDLGGKSSAPVNDETQPGE